MKRFSYLVIFFSPFFMHGMEKKPLQRSKSTPPERVKELVDSGRFVSLSNMKRKTSTGQSPRTNEREGAGEYNINWEKAVDLKKAVCLKNEKK